MKESFRLDDALALRTHLAKARRVWQALADARGDRHWLPVDNDSPLPVAGELAPLAPKALLFAERESLFTFDGTRFRETRPAVEPAVLFGAAACDLAAINYQDRFFADDPWYRARHAALLLVGLDCNSPCNGGFCPLTASGPFVRDSHADLVLPRGEDGWRLFVQSEAGAQAIAGFTGLSAADESRTSFAQQHEPAVVAQFAAVESLRRGVDAIQQGRVAPATWQRLGTECITCSGCTVSCPTCSCFATRQETSVPDSTINAVRFWDSCIYEGFQREASGHNPTAADGSRIERYWTHKFGSSFVARFGHVTCVGCGRCDRACPSGIGARSVLTRLGKDSAVNPGDDA